MASLATTYSREMREKFGGYRAVWVPGVPLALGDICTLEDDVLHRIGNLASLSGFQAKLTERPDTTPDEIQFTSSQSVSVEFKAAGVATPAGSALATLDAGFHVKFNRASATFFTAVGCTNPTLEDQLAVAREIIRLFQAGQWNSGWRVVTEVVRADSMTLLISQSKNAAVDIKAKASIGATTNIAEVDAGLSIASSRDMHTSIVAKGGLTPLVRTRRVKKKLFGKPSFGGVFKAQAHGPGLDADLEALPLDGLTPELRKLDILTAMLELADD